jgi:hypothetical protein
MIDRAMASLRGEASGMSKEDFLRNCVEQIRKQPAKKKKDKKAKRKSLDNLRAALARTRGPDPSRSVVRSARIEYR